jgi:uncharacterized lipoprotein YajG
MIAAICTRKGRVAPTLLILAAAILLAGCADKTIRLTYTPPTPSQSLAPRLIIGPFQDVRGNEGDHGDAYRVGGVYGGYGNRLAKVILASPWPPTLAEALAAEFRAQGVDATAAESAPLPTDAYRLGGDVRNFSTEARWGREAHIGVTLRLVAPDGRPLMEKRIDVRDSGYTLNNFNTEILEELLNRAFARFVRDVASDAEIRGVLR